MRADTYSVSQLTRTSMLPRVVPIMEDMAGDLGTVAINAAVLAERFALTTCFFIELLLP